MPTSLAHRLLVLQTTNQLATLGSQSNGQNSSSRQIVVPKKKSGFLNFVEGFVFGHKSQQEGKNQWQGRPSIAQLHQAIAQQPAPQPRKVLPHHQQRLDMLKSGYAQTPTAAVPSPSMQASMQHLALQQAAMSASQNPRQQLAYQHAQQLQAQTTAATRPWQATAVTQASLPSNYVKMSHPATHLHQLILDLEAQAEKIQHISHNLYQEAKRDIHVLHRLLEVLRSKHPAEESFDVAYNNFWVIFGQAFKKLKVVQHQAPAYALALGGE
jgi:hypothetical protein